jgi:GAF domain-containing protein
MREPLFDSLFKKISTILNGVTTVDEKLQSVCHLLKARVTHYDWVGFYRVDPDRSRDLILGPFAGAPTEHTRIPFGQGICGQAAERAETFMIQDVRQETNYLACSLLVKSEIVVPVFKNGQVIGELDIDSHQLAAFSAADQSFLEKVAARVSEIL